MRAGMVIAWALVSSLAWAIPSPGTKAPNFSVKDIDGKPVSLQQFKGKTPILYNVWSTACPVSQKQVPHVSKLAAKYKGKVVVIEGNVDAKAPQLKSYLKKHSLMNSKVVMDTDKTVAVAYGARVTPTAYLIDKNGVIQAVYAGYNKGDEKMMDQDIQTLLQTGKVPPRRMMMKMGGG